MSIFTSLFPSLTDKFLRKNQVFLQAVNNKGSEISNLSESEFKTKISQLKENYQTAVNKGNNRLLEEITIEVFALVREAASRVLNQRHFDVQILGGLAIWEGKIVEMKTGEGKTLAATLPAVLGAITGDGVHIITVNDYLAKRDTVWMGQVYYYLGLTVACVTQDGAFQYDPFYKLDTPQQSVIDKQRDKEGSFRVFYEYLKPINRKEAYLCDITYGTNSEFGFDYLRDNLVYSLSQKVQTGHSYAIIDEVDSILIDEARTPLIISMPDEEASSLYQLFAKLASNLKEEEDYTANDKEKAISLTEQGMDRLEKMFQGNIFNEKGWILVHHLENALKALRHYKKDRDYIVKDGKIIIIDEFTGRLLPDRRYSGGLHQALEAKEKVPIQKESRTLATITIQNYFRMYKKLSGMTGTALTSAEEFKKVYNLDVIAIPTNKPMIRKDLPDRIYRSLNGKMKALIEDVRDRHNKGQPILIGTPSVEKNELFAKYLRNAGLPFEMLNAKNHEKEGEVIAQAGRLGAITLATNLAGRGVDIILGGYPPTTVKTQGSKKGIRNGETEAITPEYHKWEQDREKVIALGGLHVIGTERHEARRIDDQLRGRSGRQGDPGSSQFYLSLEDDLVKLFAPAYLSSLMQKLGWPEDEPIEHPLVSRAIVMAQSKIEGFYFDIRKHILEYDDVINKQRMAFYNWRDSILQKAESGLLENEIQNIFKEKNEEYPEELLSKKIEQQKITQEKIIETFKLLALQILDLMWMSHIEEMESLRDSTNLRVYGGADALVEYKKESFYLYQDLKEKFKIYLIQNIKSFAQNL